MGNKETSGFLRQFNPLEISGNFIKKHPKLIPVALIGLASLPPLNLGKEVALAWGMPIGFLVIILASVFDKLGQMPRSKNS